MARFLCTQTPITRAEWEACRESSKRLKSYSPLRCEYCGEVACWEEYSNNQSNTTQHFAKIVCTDCYEHFIKERTNGKTSKH